MEYSSLVLGVKVWVRFQTHGPNPLKEIVRLDLSLLLFLESVDFLITHIYDLSSYKSINFNV